MIFFQYHFFRYSIGKRWQQNPATILKMSLTKEKNHSGHTHPPTQTLPKSADNSQQTLKMNFLSHYSAPPVCYYFHFTGLFGNPERTPHDPKYIISWLKNAKSFPLQPSQDHYKALQSPNSIPFHSNNLNGVQNTILDLSPSVTGTWFYPLARSKVENQRAPVNVSNVSSIGGSENASFLVFAFSCW